MISKYGYEFEKTVIEKNIMRLINQIWKLIPMRENKEDWEKQLKCIIVEISGMEEIFCMQPLFLQILSKMEGILKTDIDFLTYRKIVFEAISILQELKNNA